MNLHPLLIGLAAGQRSMTPLAAVALAARSRRLPRNSGAPRIMGRSYAALGAIALAVGELFGDKMRSAPDRTVPPGLLARLVTGGIAGAALAHHSRRREAAVMGAAGAVLASYIGLALRKRGMRRFGQTKSGLVEDAATLAATVMIMNAARRAS